ncbi:MAG: 2-amino-4-hydroxy-6-hydroxymethyldihydropteridine diphosphokinase [Neisseriaceae bacterium]|nr:2-amino-4-hydroxy-6-hydroxymethyldihydropteridine diphosphokinase [Neisseriaceae bacterium]
MKQAVIALGSNLDNPKQQIYDAIDKLKSLPESNIIKTSSLYCSKPVGYLDQPDFINAIILLETNLDKYDLLSQLQHIENISGRVRLFTNSPRTLDLDIIDYNNENNDDPKLILPHPRASERSFVILPLLEIAPDYIINGINISEIAKKIDNSGIYKLKETLAKPRH